MFQNMFQHFFLTLYSFNNVLCFILFHKKETSILSCYRPPIFQSRFKEGKQESDGDASKIMWCLIFPLFLIPMLCSEYSPEVSVIRLDMFQVTFIQKCQKSHYHKTYYILVIPKFWRLPSALLIGHPRSTFLETKKPKGAQNNIG